MDDDLKDCWWELIYTLADELKSNSITYNFDNETILFIHGIDYELDDVDITVKWSDFDKTHNCFCKYNASEILVSNMSEFHFIVGGFKVHIISSPKFDEIEKDDERIVFNRDGHELWSRTLMFYRNHLNSDNPLANFKDLIDFFIETSNY